MSAPETEVAKDDAQFLATYLADKARKDSDQRIDWYEIEDRHAILLLALHRSLGGRTFECSFSRNEAASLSPLWSGNFVTELFRAGILLDSPDPAKPGAYFLKEAKVWHYNDKVLYRVVPDEYCEIPHQAIAILEARGCTDPHAVEMLWFDYATLECLRYLIDQADLHGLSLPQEVIDEASQMLRTQLQSHSIAQLWAVLWKVVRDVVALKEREFYNKHRAIATIPGKIGRMVSEAKKRRDPLKAWDRPTDQAPGTIGDVFFDLFGIDESTGGSDVTAAINEATKATLSKQGTPVISEWLTVRLKGLAVRAAMMDELPEMLVQFHGAAALGLPLVAAIELLEERYPEEPNQPKEEKEDG